MRNMNEQNIARLEAQLERLVEGAFANLFGKTVRAQDIALHLARAMEDSLRAAHGSDPRPLAPDQYLIYMNPNVQARFLQQPGLPQILSHHLVELATQAGYRLANAPLVKLLADPALELSKLIVKAEHTNRPENSTAVMERVALPGESPAPSNPQIIINGETTIQLKEALINIGRSRDNHIIIDDRYISRHHVQLRLRFGAYMLFDVQSQSGTLVNGVRVKEHQLRAGDVISIGKTQLIYIEDDPLSDSQVGTGSFDSI